MPTTATARQVLKQNTGSNKNRFANIAWPLIIGFYVLLSFLVISPEGNFPLNDDWVYGYGVKSLLEHGRIEMPSSFSTAFVHIGLGSLVCKIFGYSYTALHWSTALLGVVAIAAFYLVLKELKVRENIAGFVTLMFAANPLIVHLMFSFMTDIPAIAFANLYFLFVLRGIRQNSMPYYLLSSLMLCAAAGVRQGNLLFVVPNFIVLALSIIRKGLNRKDILLVLLLVVFPVALTVGLEAELSQGISKCAEYAGFKQAHTNFFKDMLRVPLQWLFSMTVALGQVSCYFGLYCLPLLVLFMRPIIGNVGRLATWMTLAAVVVSTALTKLVVADKRLMPFSGITLRIPEIGAHNLMGISLPALSNSWRMKLTHLCGVLAFFFLVVLGSGLQRAAALSMRKSVRALMVVFVFASSLVSLGCVTMETVILDIDRHYLIALAPVLIALAVTSRWWKVSSLASALGIVSCLLLVLIAGYSTLATQDHLSWNRARWRAIAKLEAQGINPNVIDGGPEYAFPRDPDLNFQIWRGVPRKSMRDYWRWWRVRDDQYIVSFSPVPGYEEIGREPYFSGLTFGQNYVLTLKRVVPDKPFVGPDQIKQGG